MTDNRYVKVYQKKDEESPVEFPLNDDGGLSIDDIKRIFPGSIGLGYFTSNGSMRFLRKNQSGYISPDSGWSDVQIFVEYPRPHSPLKPIVQEKTSWKRARIEEEADEAQKKPDPKDVEWFNSLKLYALYYEDENKTKHCITPITTRIAATYAHGCHAQLTMDRTKKKPIEVRCYYDKKYCVAAKVVLRSDGHDIVILQAISKNFIEKNPVVVLPQIGMRYLMLGLSNIEDVDEPFSLGIGSIKAILSDVNRYIGSSGCSKGDSGAGIWNSDGNLIGMNILKHNPVKMKESRQGTHKQYTHAIGGAAIFIPAGTIKSFASEYIPKTFPVEFEE
uniref:TAR DNA-binding protein 43 N-terminal domain-containing protein n=1 Tax=Acrobeloides nanus TaxID=290746 RepID=A0A914CAQ6_9BILA